MAEKETDPQDNDASERKESESRELDLQPIEPAKNTLESNARQEENSGNEDREDRGESHQKAETVPEEYEEIPDDDFEERPAQQEDEEYTYDYPADAFAVSDKDDEEQYEPVKTKYPLFNQQHNTCGLSSMLMLLDPIENQYLKSFLEEIWEHVKKILLPLKLKKDEFKWSHGLEYLLLKSYHQNLLSEYIMEHKQFADDYYISRVPLEVHLRQLQEMHYNLGRMEIYDEYKTFFDDGTVTHFILTDQIGQMKDAKEVEMLFSLLGYDFVPQYSPDGTGGIFFTRKELKNQDDVSVHQRLRKLEHEFNKGAKIMLGMYHHWLAVTEIGKKRRGYYIVVNDPNTAKKYRLPLKKLRDTDRFYIFKKRNEDVKAFWQQVRAWMDTEIKRDQKAFVEFKKKLQENLKKRLQLEGQTEQKATHKIKIAEHQVENVSKQELTTIPVENKTKVGDTSQQINAVKAAPDVNINQEEDEDIIDLSSSRVILEENREPLSGKAFMDNIRKIIRANFSDYSKL